MIENLKLELQKNDYFCNVENLYIESITNIRVSYLDVPPNPINDKRQLIRANENNERYIYTLLITPLSGVDAPLWRSTNVKTGLFAVVYITAQTNPPVEINDILQGGYWFFLEPYNLETNLNPDSSGYYLFKTGTTRRLDLHLTAQQNVWIYPFFDETVHYEPYINVTIVKRKLPDWEYYANKIKNVYSRLRQKILFGR